MSAEQITNVICSCCRASSEKVTYSELQTLYQCGQQGLFHRIIPAKWKVFAEYFIYILHLEQFKNGASRLSACVLDLFSTLYIDHEKFFRVINGCEEYGNCLMGIMLAFYKSVDFSHYRGYKNYRYRLRE